MEQQTKKKSVKIKNCRFAHSAIRPIRICSSITTMQRRIGDIAGNIRKQLQDPASSFCYFSLALDESTDVSDIVQLLVFVRGVDCNFEVTQELAGLSSMHGQTFTLPFPTLHFFYSPYLPSFFPFSLS